MNVRNVEEYPVKDNQIVLTTIIRRTVIIPCVTELGETNL